MIKQFIQELVEQISDRDDVAFITGDVGYRSLDPIKQLLGSKFINAGIAEQNMINVAAGMANEGFKVYVYSIAPFLLYRAYEQIKLNVASRNLDVNLVANGGGYGYGIMGPSHHALNDLALISGLDNMQGYVPACELDVYRSVLESLNTGPKYFRLGLNPNKIEKTFDHGFGSVNISEEAKSTVVSLGPIAQEFLDIQKDFDHFSCFEFPFTEIPSSLEESINKTKRLLVAEEHTQSGGLGEKIIALLHEKNLEFNFLHRFANHYHGKFGDQNFHRIQNGLCRDSFSKIV